jgi:hypothetical protein
MILIYNLNGEQLKKYTFSSHGKQSIVINGNEFNAGSYYYTLIVDNKEVDTKKMILVKLSQYENGFNMLSLNNTSFVI